MLKNGAYTGNGSSPRVRGKLVLLALPSRPIRIIPARAGQTWRRASSTPCPTDHPRACGANNWRSTGKGPSYGSSPRVRGKLTGSVKEDFSMNGRIIPARAGQTQAHRLRPYLHPDHPRACGANEAQDGSDDLVPGSSPRVRGKRARPATAHERRRIIPARAGQTIRLLGTVHGDSDHPRACGANNCFDLTVPGDPGSSPRVRGKHGFSGDLVAPVRIIPARAGQTVCCVVDIALLPDHPRACGANADTGVSTWNMTGSSPRVRGKR